MESRATRDGAQESSLAAAARVTLLTKRRNVTDAAEPQKQRRVRVQSSSASASGSDSASGSGSDPGSGSGRLGRPAAGATSAPAAVGWKLQNFDPAVGLELTVSRGSAKFAVTPHGEAATIMIDGGDRFVVVISVRPPRVDYTSINVSLQVVKVLAMIQFVPGVNRKFSADNNGEAAVD